MLGCKILECNTIIYKTINFLYYMPQTLKKEEDQQFAEAIYQQKKIWKTTDSRKRLIAKLRNSVEN